MKKESPLSDGMVMTFTDTHTLTQMITAHFNYDKQFIFSKADHYINSKDVSKGGRQKVKH